MTPLKDKSSCIVIDRRLEIFHLYLCFCGCMVTNVSSGNSDVFLLSFRGLALMFIYECIMKLDIFIVSVRAVCTVFACSTDSDLVILLNISNRITLTSSFVSYKLM